MRSIKYLNKDFNFYIHVLKIYLDCPFFDSDKKKVIKKFIRKLFIRKKKFLFKTNTFFQFLNEIYHTN